jgi:hypothetical protein
VNGTGQIVLARDEALQVHAVLGVVEDWLLHCDPWITDDLTGFLHPGGRARQVIDQLGDAGCILGQLLHQQEEQ